MRRRPPNHAKPWTPEEVDRLRRLMSESLSIRAVAKELGRTPDSVMSRVKTEKIPRNVPAGS
jgi:hypothetical protein